MKAEIIAVGTEILLGDIVNTNAQYLSKELASIGIEVFHEEVIGDNEDRLLEAIEHGFNRSDIIITTGGLGPTQDDLTKETACKYFGMDLVIFFMGTLNGVNFFYANHFYQEALPVLNVGGCVPFNYLLVIFVFILCVVVLGENIYFTDIIGSLVIISFHAYNAWVPIQNEK